MKFDDIKIGEIYLDSDGDYLLIRSKDNVIKYNNRHYLCDIIKGSNQGQIGFSLSEDSSLVDSLKLASPLIKALYGFKP